MASKQLQTALDAAETTIAEVMAKVQAAGDAKRALDAATAANTAALKAALDSSSALEAARTAAHAAVDVEFTLAPTKPPEATQGAASAST